MMRYAVEISEQAVRDLQGVFAYIAYELKSLQNASGQLQGWKRASSLWSNCRSGFADIGKSLGTAEGCA